LYYNNDTDKFITSFVNPDPDSIPNFEGFSFDSANKDSFIAGESITNVYIYFDANSGTNSTITSTNGVLNLSPSTPNSNFYYFNYNCSQITDNLIITSWNLNNTKSKIIEVPITLTTTQVVPLSFSNNPTTQDFQYNSLVINFNKAVKSIGNITSSQDPGQTILYSVNNTTSVTILSYKTPANITDTLTFSSVVDTSDISNTGNVTLNVNNLKIGPSLIGLIGSLNTISQSFQYTDIEVDISKNIIQNPVTPISISSSGPNNPTNVE
jgi:hypothetical protein